MQYVNGDETIESCTTESFTHGGDCFHGALAAHRECSFRDAVHSPKPNSALDWPTGRKTESDPLRKPRDVVNFPLRSDPLIRQEQLKHCSRYPGSLATADLDVPTMTLDDLATYP